MKKSWGWNSISALEEEEGYEEISAKEAAAQAALIRFQLQNEDVHREEKSTQNQVVAIENGPRLAEQQISHQEKLLEISEMTDAMETDNDHSSSEAEVKEQKVSTSGKLEEEMTKSQRVFAEEIELPLDSELSRLQQASMEQRNKIIGAINGLHSECQIEEGKSALSTIATILR